MCDQLAVMYAGRLVRSGSVSRVFNAPAHPYTKALLNSIPRMRDRSQRLTAIASPAADLAKLTRGCAFAERCPQVFDRCRDGGRAGLPEWAMGNWRVAGWAGCRQATGCLANGLMPIIEAEGLTKHFSTKRGLFGAGQVWCARSTGFRSPSSLVARWASSASPAVARRRRRSSCWGSSSRRVGRCGSRGATCRSSMRRGGASTADRFRRCSRTRLARSTRACGSARSSPSRWSSMRRLTAAR